MATTIGVSTGTKDKYRLVKLWRQFKANKSISDDEIIAEWVENEYVKIPPEVLEQLEQIQS